MRDYTKLRAYQLADEVVLDVYGATKDFPPSERYGLRSQIRRAAVSVASNIVEGATRYSRREYPRFLDTAFSSACELKYQLSVGQRLGFMSESVAGRLASKCEELTKVLNGLVRAHREQLRIGLE